MMFKELCVKFNGPTSTANGKIQFSSKQQFRYCHVQLTLISINVIESVFRSVNFVFIFYSFCLTLLEFR